jgi:ArsR family transcriptional regulator
MFVEKGSPDKLARGQFERIAKALADPRRFALFETIASAERQCPYQKLCNDFPVTKATISHHLKELVSAGLIETEREGQFVHARAVPGILDAYASELIRRAGCVSAGSDRPSIRFVPVPE